MEDILDTIYEFVFFITGFLLLFTFAGLLGLMIKAIVYEFSDEDEVLPPPSDRCKRDYADKSWLRNRGK